MYLSLQNATDFLFKNSPWTATLSFCLLRTCKFVTHEFYFVGTFMTKLNKYCYSLIVNKRNDVYTTCRDNYFFNINKRPLQR